MKTWQITAELFFDASRIESVVVEANTERKAKIYADLSFKKKYPYIRDMISIQKVERIDK